MIHPDTELKFISETIGYGLVAKKFIPKGTITWVQDDLDQIYSRDREVEMPDLIREQLEKYSFTNSKGEKVLCWDNAKYVNHSFRPSCMSTAYDFEIAVRDIHPGEQLTDDYGYLNVEEPFEAEDEGTDRKVVYPDDLLRYYKEWDDLIRENLPEIRKVEQPLQVYIREDRWKEFSDVLDSNAELKSILTCYYDPPTH